VTLINNSVNASNYLWDFGDSETAIDENPIHTYALSGSYTIELTAYSDLCGNDTETQLVNISTSVYGTGFENQISLYPNPARGMINLEIDLQSNEKLVVEIWNVNSQLLHQQSFAGQKIKAEIDLSAWASGLYVVKINNQKSLEIRKLLIE
jgi:PKD repeat protein